MMNLERSGQAFMLRTLVNCSIASSEVRRRVSHSEQLTAELHYLRAVMHLSQVAMDPLHELHACMPQLARDGEHRHGCTQARGGPASRR